MLVIKRKPGEKIIIGDRLIEILLVESRGSARIGIKAPEDIAVHREEVYEAIQNEKRKLTGGLG